MGNGYRAGDSHGNYLQDQNALGTGNGGYGDKGLGPSYSKTDAHHHLYGYDSVQPEDKDDWATVSADAATMVTNLNTLIGNANTARETYINAVLQRRKDRLADIHEDNLLKIEAPFELQLDLLEEELEDLQKAEDYAADDAAKALADLLERINDYLTSRIDALDREEGRVIRALERAVDDKKPVDEVLYAMRLDWLQGVYVAGTAAYYDKDIYDFAVFDTEFDIFTYDIGHGKGHGHRTGTHGPGNDREQGFVYGAEGSGDISELNGRPKPVGGKRGRYDRATQSGHGSPHKPSDYEVGVKAGTKEGAYRYNQKADLMADTKPKGRYGKKPSYRGKPKSRYGKRPPTKKPTYGKRAPTKRPSYRKPSYKKPAYKKPAYGKRTYGKPSYAPKQGYQKTRTISKKTVYDDYAPIPRGGYGYRGGYSGAY